MIRKTIPLLVLALVAGCSSKNADLDRFMAQVRQEQPGGVEPLPEIKPYETFAYESQHMRSPFAPGGSGNSSAPGLRPNSNRNREFLEQFSLDTLKMKGALEIAGKRYGLVQTRSNIVYRVLPGNYMGQNEGRIVDITPNQINLIELVPDGLGGYVERPARLDLAN
jgi:type IV pilus assembly protein PilP